jgi:Periplasmic binding protein-like domain
VTVDNYHGMRAGTQHLIDLGHTRIAYIRGDADMESTEQRFQGFSDALRLAGLPVDPRLVASCDFTYTCGFRTAAALIADHRPTALCSRCTSTARRTPRPSTATFPCCTPPQCSTTPPARSPSSRSTAQTEPLPLRCANEMTGVTPARDH